MVKNTEKQIFTKIWAPTLVSFTNWVLQELRSRGINKVYFLARDGYMSYLIAGKLIAQNNLPIECKLLSCSRYAFRMAEYHLPDSEPIDKICIGGIDVSIRTILRRGGLTEAEQDEIYALLKEQKIVTEEMNQSLSYARILQLKDGLKNCVKLNDYIKAHALDAYAGTMAYLKQEGLMSDSPFAIVDSGWVGSIQQTLEHLLAAEGLQSSNPIEGFYFGLYELPKGADKSRYHTFYFRPYKDIRRKVSFSNCLFEAVISSPEGMTTGYEMQGKMVPVKENEKNLNAERVTENIACLKEFLSKEDVLKEPPSVKEIHRLLSKLMGKPDKEEAECFGSYLFSDDVLSLKAKKLSENLSDEDLKNLGVLNRFLLMKGIRKGKRNETAWPEGSVVLSGKHVSFNLCRVRCYKYLIYIRKNWKR